MKAILVLFFGVFEQFSTSKEVLCLQQFNKYTKITYFRGIKCITQLFYYIIVLFIYLFYLYLYIYISRINCSPAIYFLCWQPFHPHHRGAIKYCEVHNKECEYWEPGKYPGVIKWKQKYFILQYFSKIHTPHPHPNIALTANLIYCIVLSIVQCALYNSVTCSAFKRLCLSKRYISLLCKMTF